MTVSTPTKTQINAYLFFGGRCEEALSFYESAVNATIKAVMRFSDSPDPIPEGMLAPGYEHKVMHCEFQVGETTIMASDGCGESKSFNGFSLALSVPTEADADRVFNALAEDGVINMPLTKTFWSPRYGMVVDKYGVHWMVMVPGGH
jgi:PhnB protein